jgi:5-methylcytosine-specific restriction endonuclease McrA
MIPVVKTKADRARFYGSTAWKELRQSILKRDNFECQWCKEEGLVVIDGGFDKNGNPVVLEVDHIKELETNPELAYDSDNLRTLCKDCHNKRHKRMNYRGNKRKRKWDDEFDIL